MGSCCALPTATIAIAEDDHCYSSDDSYSGSFSSVSECDIPPREGGQRGGASSVPHHKRRLHRRQQSNQHRQDGDDRSGAHEDSQEEEEPRERSRRWSLTLNSPTRRNAPKVGSIFAAAPATNDDHHPSNDVTATTTRSNNDEDSILVPELDSRARGNQQQQHPQALTPLLVFQAHPAGGGATTTATGTTVSQTSPRSRSGNELHRQTSQNMKLVIGTSRSLSPNMTPISLPSDRNLHHTSSQQTTAPSTAAPITGATTSMIERPSAFILPPPVPSPTTTRGHSSHGRGGAGSSYARGGPLSPSPGPPIDPIAAEKQKEMHRSALYVREHRSRMGSLDLDSPSASLSPTGRGTFIFPR